MENKESKTVTLEITYQVKKAKDKNAICRDCALRRGIFGCLKRSACPDDGSGLNLMYKDVIKK